LAGFLFLVIAGWIEAIKSGLKQGIARMVKVGQKQIPAWIEGGSDPTKVLFESADNCWAPQGPFSVFCEKRRELQEPRIYRTRFSVEG
jgi:hypothetical protein